MAAELGRGREDLLPEELRLRRRRSLREANARGTGMADNQAALITPAFVPSTPYYGLPCRVAYPAAVQYNVPEALHSPGTRGRPADHRRVPLALLISSSSTGGTVPTAFLGPLKLQQRLGGLEHGAIRDNRSGTGSWRSSARSRRSTASRATWPSAGPGAGRGQRRYRRRRRPRLDRRDNGRSEAADRGTAGLGWR